MNTFLKLNNIIINIEINYTLTITNRINIAIQINFIFSSFILNIHIFDIHTVKHRLLERQSKFRLSNNQLFKNKMNMYLK